MKKLILITIMLLSTLACASRLDSYTLPTKSDRYTAYVNDLKYSDGTDIEVGKFFMYNAWEDYTWYKYNWISCKITDIKSEYDTYQQEYDLTLDCTVEERTQFYLSDVTYYDLNGYRTDGTLKWSRDKAGSTDIYCYNKSGMYVIKRVNDPYYCK